MVPEKKKKKKSRDLCEELVCDVLGAGLSPDKKTAQLVPVTSASVFICASAFCHQQSPGTAPSTL